MHLDGEKGQPPAEFTRSAMPVDVFLENPISNSASGCDAPEDGAVKMKTGFRRGLRTAVAGSLLCGGTLVASVLAGSPPASAAEVVATIPVGLQPTGVSSDGTHVWVTNGSQTVSEILASTGAVVNTIPVDADPWVFRRTALTSGWRTPPPIR